MCFASLAFGVTVAVSRFAVSAVIFEFAGLATLASVGSSASVDCYSFWRGVAVGSLTAFGSLSAIARLCGIGSCRLSCQPLRRSWTGSWCFTRWALSGGRYSCGWSFRKSWRTSVGGRSFTVGAGTSRGSNGRSTSWCSSCSSYGRSRSRTTFCAGTDGHFLPSVPLSILPPTGTGQATSKNPTHVEERRPFKDVALREL